VCACVCAYACACVRVYACDGIHFGLGLQTKISCVRVCMSVCGCVCMWWVCVQTGATDRSIVKHTNVCACVSCVCLRVHVCVCVFACACLCVGVGACDGIHFGLGQQTEKRHDVIDTLDKAREKRKKEKNRHKRVRCRWREI